MANKLTTNSLDSHSLDKKTGNDPLSKAVTRYLFVCIGMIIYIMPSLSCLYFGIMTDGMSSAFIVAIITEVMSFPVGFMGILAIKKKGLHIASLVCAVIAIALHIYTLITVGVWYVIIAPSLILIIFFIPFSSVTKKDITNVKFF